MSIIKEIYSSTHFDWGKNQQSRNMELDIQRLLNQWKQVDQQEEEQIEEFFYKACSRGQEYGFWSGIRFGVRLTAECLL